MVDMHYIILAAGS